MSVWELEWSALQVGARPPLRVAHGAGDHCSDAVHRSTPISDLARLRLSFGPVPRQVNVTAFAAPPLKGSLGTVTTTGNVTYGRPPPNPSRPPLANAPFPPLSSRRRSGRPL